MPQARGDDIDVALGVTHEGPHITRASTSDSEIAEYEEHERLTPIYHGITD